MAVGVNDLPKRVVVPFGSDKTELFTAANPARVSEIASGVNAAISTTVVPAGTGDVAAVAAVAGLRYFGFSAKETVAAVAQVIIRHGATDAGPELDIVNFTANQSVREWYGPQGISAPNGIFVDRPSGTTLLVIYHAAIT